MDTFFCFVRRLVHFAMLCVLVIFSLSIYVYLLSVHSTYPMLCSCRSIQRPSQKNLCILCKYILCGRGQRLHKCAALSRSNLFILQLSKANLKCQRNSVKLFSVIRGHGSSGFQLTPYIKRTCNASHETHFARHLSCAQPSGFPFSIFPLSRLSLATTSPLHPASQPYFAWKIRAAIC